MSRSSHIGRGIPSLLILDTKSYLSSPLPYLTDLSRIETKMGQAAAVHAIDIHALAPGHHTRFLFFHLLLLVQRRDKRLLYSEASHWR